MHRSFSVVSAVSILASSAASARPEDRIPAATPALPPAEAEAKFVVPEGFEVRLFASEPMVINPVAMTWDERGRLWVVELFEYPSGAKEGTVPRDKVKVLEDTDADGRADKVTVFAEGLDLATGIAIGDGGVYVGQAPDLLFFRDLDGDDVADSRQVVLTGFGLEDRHELLNSFTWGPDGQLYMTHGVFTHSKVRRPGEDAADGAVMNAAVARVDTRDGFRFEVFADGTSNPWGVDFDKHGEAFLSACVIDHMFHMAPGGLYARQSGAPQFPYAYELLPSIVDHSHFRAAYAGVQVYQADAYPAEWRDTIFIGNIHGNCVHQDILTPRGSTFLSQHGTDFLTTDDGWFRPVSTQTGPDGCLWVMDWCDKYPCYQNAMADPEGVDREFGRIWRVVYTGDEPGKEVPSRPDPAMDYGGEAPPALAAALEHPNNWHRRTARRLLSERADKAAKGPLLALLHSEKPVEVRLEALWALDGSGLLDGKQLEALCASREPALRKWAARLVGERRGAPARLEALAADPDPAVRRAVATALRQQVSARLTVDEAPGGKNPPPDIFPVWEQVMRASAEENDRGVSFQLWMALEPLVAGEPTATFDRLLGPASSGGEMGRKMVWRTARRLSDDPGRAAANMAHVARAIPGLLGERRPLAVAALEGVLASQRDRVVAPGDEAASRALFAALAGAGDGKLAELGGQLGTLWGDPAALAALVARINDPGASRDDRLAAVRAARKVKGDASRDALLQLVRSEADDKGLLAEAVNGLAELGGDAVPTVLLERWPLLTGPARGSASAALAGRGRWALAFLDEIAAGNIARDAVPPNILQRLSSHGDADVRGRALEVIGRYRLPARELQQRIAEKKHAVANGPVDLEAGRALATTTCLICHQFHGQGIAVGPDLTGSGRSNLDALLANVLDPNQIIGRGYENIVIETEDGRTLSGRVVAENETTVKLLGAAGIEQTADKSQIKKRTDTGESLMPGGFFDLPDEDLRNLIWFILAPPEDGRELTPALRRQLIGNPAPVARDPGRHPAVDMESVSLWNPDWHIVCPPFEGAPNVESEFAGRKNVLRTHPIDTNEPAVLERFVTVPAGAAKAELRLTVAAHEHPEGDWRLRVLVDSEPALDRIIDKEGERWKTATVDLTPHRGKTVLVALENAANNWMYEFAYWGEIALDLEPGGE